MVWRGDAFRRCPPRNRRRKPVFDDETLGLEGIVSKRAGSFYKSRLEAAIG
jgi:hypothetical protein